MSDIRARFRALIQRANRNAPGTFKRPIRLVVDHGRSDHGRSDHGRSDHGRSDHGRSDHERSDHERSDHERSDHGSMLPEQVEDFVLNLPCKALVTYGDGAQTTFPRLTWQKAVERKVPILRGGGTRVRTEWFALT